MKPVVKWTGGKTQSLPILTKKMPDRFKVYIEPFFGGGAMYFNIAPKQAIIGDINMQLINVYKMIAMYPEELMNKLDNLTREYNVLADYNDRKNYYYRKRTEFNRAITYLYYDVNTAALFIFLNKCSFNGLYRINSQGLYNVPWGYKTKVNLYQKDNILEIADSFKHCDILATDFENTANKALPGDFVFFDSPCYDRYDANRVGGFTEMEHRRLYNLFDELSNNGVKCMLMNSDSDYIKRLYGQYNIEEIDTKCIINSKGVTKKVREVVITNY